MIKISKFSNTIEYNLRTTLDASGITQLQGQLSSINTQLDQMSKKQLISSQEAAQAQRQIKQLGDALSSSLNPQTGLLDLGKFKQQLSGLSLSQLEQSMSKVGATGQIAFGNMIGQIGRMDTSFKSISSFADKIFNTMGNTVRWGITASIFQTIQNSLYRAVDYVQELDTSLNNIRIVTSASNEDMRNFALYANEAAQAIGASTTSFTDAAQLYAQNGFNEEDYIRLKNSYVLTKDKLALARGDMAVLHPLPRVNEITLNVDDDPRAAYFEQAQNGVYMRMALIMTLLGLKDPKTGEVAFDVNG